MNEILIPFSTLFTRSLNVFNSSGSKIFGIKSHSQYSWRSLSSVSGGTSKITHQTQLNICKIIHAMNSLVWKALQRKLMKNVSLLRKPELGLAGFLKEPIIPVRLSLKTNSMIEILQSYIFQSRAVYFLNYIILPL